MADYDRDRLEALPKGVRKKRQKIGVYPNTDERQFIKDITEKHNCSASRAIRMCIRHVMSEYKMRANANLERLKDIELNNINISAIAGLTGAGGSSHVD